MKEGILKKIEDFLLALINTDEKFKQLFIVEIQEHKNHTIAVFVDSDENLDINTCAVLSRTLEAFIEEHQLLPEKYTLEVSSPGLDNPLKLMRQYKKNIGRTLEITTMGGEKEEGKLTALSEEACTIEQIVKQKDEVTKKKKEVTITKTFLFKDIKTALVKISF